MSIMENQRLMAKVCELYYLSELSQKEVSSRLGISRPQISRIIAQARAQGMVEIHVRNPHETDTALERQLVRRYALEDAFVVSIPEGEPEERELAFSREAASYLDFLLGAGVSLGVMSGKTIAGMAHQLRGGGRTLGEIVPLVGGIGPVAPDLHANTIAMTIARNLGGTPLVLNAPLVVSSPEAAALLRQEQGIARVLEKGARCDYYLIGIGKADARSTTAQAGGLTPEDLELLRREGACCSACNSYFDRDGREIIALRDRSIGLGLLELKKGRVIACARGTSKTEAIRAALKTGRVHLLMTDAETARTLL
ncbi:MAG: hypothetical protein IJ231_10625 [Clostridia bacterium]|nr:hypothetical protein [Clostridia bacterium]